MTIEDEPPQRRTVADVHIGRDDWLFLTGGSNRVLDQFGVQGFPRASLWKWRTLLSERVRRCARLGAVYAHAVAPEKLTIYHDATHDLPFDPKRAPALRLRRWLTGSRAARAWVDLVAPLRAARHDAPLYLRTDSHWTFEGCEIAYRAICAKLRVAPRDDIRARRVDTPEIYIGDLGSKLDPFRSQTLRSCRFETAAVRHSANGLIHHHEALGRIGDAHIGAHAVFRNADPKADPRRIVVFGDSYAHHAPNSPVSTLTPFLADTFREVHFLWSTSIDWSYLDTVRPDFVLGEIAERFMIEIPIRGFRIDLLADLALERKATTAP